MALAENGNAFYKWNMSLQNKHIPTKSNQIKIKEEFKESLALLKHQTGLTLSQLIANCFQI